MPIISYQDRQVFFKIDGEGFPLVLLHGFCEDHRIWNDLIPTVENAQIIRIDLPGFGGSETPEQASIDHYAAAVKQVLDHLGIRQCLLIGHSMGGYTTLAFAELYPEYLKGFGLFHSHPFADTPEKKQARDKSVQFIQKNGAIHYLKQLIPKLFPSHFLSSKRYLVDRIIFQASKFDPAGIMGGLEAMKNRRDRSLVLQQTPLPVLFILGEHDNLIPFEQQLEQTHWPSTSNVHILLRTGHMGLVEAPHKTARMIQQFLSFCTTR